MFPARALTVAMAAGALLTSVLPAASMTTSHIATDAELVEILPTPSFVAEGRIGDLGGAATFELDLGASTAAPDQMAQYDWPNGVPVPLTLSHDGVGTVTFTVGDVSLFYVPLIDFEDIFIRTRAVETDTHILVDELVLDSAIVGDFSEATGSGGLDILRITDIDIAGGFVLTGEVTFSWVGDHPRNSRLAFQIMVGEPDDIVPTEVATWGRVKDLFR